MKLYLWYPSYKHQKRIFDGWVLMAVIWELPFYVHLVIIEMVYIKQKQNNLF